jgi:hypothetical protein
MTRQTRNTSFQVAEGGKTRTSTEFHQYHQLHHLYQLYQFRGELNIYRATF